MRTPPYIADVVGTKYSTFAKKILVINTCDNDPEVLDLSVANIYGLWVSAYKKAIIGYIVSDNERLRLTTNHSFEEMFDLLYPVEKHNQ